MNTIVRGNSFYLKVNVFVNDGESVQPLNLQSTDTVEANIYQELSGKKFCHSVGRVEGTENQLLIDVKDIPNGRKYVVEVVGLYNSRPFRGAKVGYIGVVEYNTDSTPIFNDEVDITVDFQSGYLCITKNAYELAVQEGYQGTLADYIAELVDNGNSAKAAREATAEAISATANANEATERANQATASAETATADAITATQQAVTATANATTATQEAVLRASEAHEATEAANSATDHAKDATTAANEATANANAATTAANGAASTANQAASAARTATNEATAATANAITATQQATIATTNAVNATSEATTATANANEATQRANQAASNTESYLEQAQTDEATRIANENQRIANENQRETFYEHFDEQLETKANKDGFYETLGAGTALNLQGNTSKDATFTYRTAGGTEDIASGLATIHSIKGNTVVWNQIFDNSKLYSAIVPTQFAASQTEEGNLRLIAKDGWNISYRYCTWNKTKFTPTPNHIVYVSVDVTEIIHPETNHVGSIWCKCGHNGSTTTLLKQGAIKEFDKPLTKGLYRQIQTVENTSCQWLLQLGCTVYNSAGNAVATSIGGWGIEVKSINIFDLTLMFGAGNEPSTVEEFEEWLTNNVGLQDYYEYSEPTMLSADANSLETVGFNQWDEEWSKGYYNSEGMAVTGSHVKNNNQIKVIPNQSYYFRTPKNVIFAFLYDENMNLVTGSIRIDNNQIFTIPSNVHYINFYLYNASSYTKGTVNINLSWSGIRNGEYEEYWKRTYPINVKQLTSNGDVIFPNGMNRVGNVYDEIVSVDGVTKAIKRIGSVDLGTRNYTYYDGSSAPTTYPYGYFTSSAPNKAGGLNILCTKYSTYLYNFTTDKSIAVSKTNTALWIVDSSYTDAATFKEAMSGVMLYYELATPIEYEIDNFEMPLAYKVDDFGTEETKKDTFSLSPTFAVTYGVNAVDTLRRLPTNYISKESMQNFLSALGVQMGGTWTMTLDNNEYKFSFVANSNENENDG